MNHNDTEIVLTLRAALIARIGQERYDVWFGTGVRLQVHGRSLRVSADRPFKLDQVRTRFRSELEHVCRRVFGAVVPIDFELDADETAERSVTPADASSSRTNSSRTNSSRTGSPQTNSPQTRSPRGNSRRAAAAAPDGNPRQPASYGSRRQLASLGDYVVGPCNCVALTAVQRVVERPGHVSPLFMYGPTGTGKTHLLEALASAARQTRSGKRAVLMSSEQFTGSFLEALHGTGLPSFRRKYRDVDLLLIDDIQFFSGKRATIVELKHTVDTLLRDRRQIVFTADRPLGEITGLGAELCARISGGLVCGIEPPDGTTRLELARRMANRLGLAIPEDVLQLLANRINGDVRQLSGALNRLQALAEARRQSVTRSLAEDSLGDVFRAANRVVRLPDVESAICDVFGIDARSLQSQRKSKMVAQPRMLAMWLARKFTRAPFAEIGEYFGKRSHSTVISAQNKVDRWLEDGGTIQLGSGDREVRDVIRLIESRLQVG